MTPPFFKNVVSNGNKMLLSMNKEMEKNIQSVYTKSASSNKCYLNVWLFIEEDFFFKNVPDSIFNITKNQKLSLDILREKAEGIETSVIDTIKTSMSDIEVKLINVKSKEIFMKAWSTKLTFNLLNNLIEALMVEDTYSHKSDDIFIIKKLEREIKTNYFKTQPSINTMARYSGMSPTKFKRVFKDVLGCSPHQYILDIRANHAKELLESNYYTISQVAYKVGFNNPSGLSRLIRTKFNVSPQEMVKR
jgi:AraC family transcriptional regulator, exoenzyme S synthesis regulatory protein ExsA